MADNNKMTTPMSPGIGGVEGLNTDVAVRNLMKHEDTRKKTTVDFSVKPGIQKVVHENLLSPFLKYGKDPQKAFSTAKENVKSIDSKDILNVFQQAKFSATFNIGKIKASIYANMSPKELIRRRGFVNSSYSTRRSNQLTQGPHDGFVDPSSRVQDVGITIMIPVK